MPRGTVTKLVHSLETGEKMSIHDQRIRRRIQDSIMQTAANDDVEIDEGELKRQLFLEEASGKTYVVSKTEVDLIISYIWDQGLTGTKNKRQMEDLYNDCALPETAIARRDKIDTKVHNVYRTFRETKQMFSDEEQDVAVLASRIFSLISCFKNREGAEEALAGYGITVDDFEE